MREQRVARHHLLHDADAQRRRGVDAAAGEGEQPRPAGADLGDQAQVRARVDADADARLGQPEARVVGGDADVAHHRDLEPRAEAVAVDRHSTGCGRSENTRKRSCTQRKRS